jgi:hypothetical protein
MSIQAWLGIGAGTLVALALPTATWFVGLSLEGVAFTPEQQRLHDIAIENARPLTDLLSRFSLAELLLGPLGIYVVGRSAGIHRATRWVTLAAVTLPLLAVLWLLGLFTMFGAIGKSL